MTELVFLKNKQALTTSLKVAEGFEKRHDHILRDIEEQYGDLPEFGEMFHKATYPDSYGRPQKMYTMNRDGFFMLVTGFTGAKAKQVKLAFIKAFNAMENALAERQSAEWQLYEVEKLQFIARTVIAGLIASSVDYHLPYKNCKAAFEAYAQLSYINERLLLAQRG